MKIIFLGPPGSGKGTQTDFIGDRLKIPTISTGNILREAIKNKTDIGLKAKEYTESGRLVPDNIIMDIIIERLKNPDCKEGYILDGVPRTIKQAESLEEMGIEFDAVIDLDVPDEVVAGRLTGRRVCSDCGATFHLEANPPKTDGICDACSGKLTQRTDDLPETVKDRIEVYHKNTVPLEEFYKKRGNLKTVPAHNDIKQITDLIFKELGLE